MKIRTQSNQELSQTLNELIIGFLFVPNHFIDCARTTPVLPNRPSLFVRYNLTLVIVVVIGFYNL
jgi:hypothetical protein